MNSHVFSTRNFQLSIFGRLANNLRHAKATAELKSQIRHERNQLAQLDNDQLRDIGVTRAQADLEASRAFDDIPEHRAKRICL